jgi:hypothetical protein
MLLGAKNWISVHHKHQFTYKGTEQLKETSETGFWGEELWG